MIYDVETEVRLHLLIIAFGKAVRLRVICGGGIANNAKLIHQHAGELGNEDRASVTIVAGLKVMVSQWINP